MDSTNLLSRAAGAVVPGRVLAIPPAGVASLARPPCLCAGTDARKARTFSSAGAAWQAGCSCPLSLPVVLPAGESREAQVVALPATPEGGGAGRRREGKRFPRRFASVTLLRGGTPPAGWRGGTEINLDGGVRVKPFEGKGIPLAALRGARSPYRFLRRGGWRLAAGAFGRGRYLLKTGRSHDDDVRDRALPSVGDGGKDATIN